MLIKPSNGGRFVLRNEERECEKASRAVTGRGRGPSWQGALTQGVKGWQHVKLHLLLELGAPQHEAEHTGVLPPTPDCKLYPEPSLSLAGFQLSPDFLDEQLPFVQLLLKTGEIDEEDDEVGVRAASEGRAFA